MPSVQLSADVERRSRQTFYLERNLDTRCPIPLRNLGSQCNCLKTPAELQCTVMQFASAILARAPIAPSASCVSCVYRVCREKEIADLNKTLYTLNAKVLHTLHMDPLP